MRILLSLTIFFFLGQYCMAATDSQCNILYRFYKNGRSYTERQCPKIIKMLAKDYHVSLFRNSKRFENRLKKDLIDCVSNGQVNDPEIIPHRIYLYDHMQMVSHCAKDYSDEDLRAMYTGTPTSRERLVDISHDLFKKQLSPEDGQFIDSLMANQGSIDDEELANDVEAISLMNKTVQKASNVIKEQKRLMAMKSDELNPKLIQEQLKAIQDVDRLQRRATSIPIDSEDYAELNNTFHHIRLNFLPQISDFPQQLQMKFSQIN